MAHDDITLEVPDDANDAEGTPEASNALSAPRTPKRMGRPPKWEGTNRTERQRSRRKAERTKRLETAKVARSPLDDLVPPGVIESESGAFRFDRTDVSLYLAKVVFGCEMDYLEAARRLRPNSGFEELERIAIQLRGNEHVARAMESLLKACGLDDSSRDEFVRIQWQWFRSGDKELRLQAARILSKIYFDKAERPAQPQPLKMEGFAEGMQRMLGDPAPQVGKVDDGEEIAIQSESAMVLLPGRSE